MTLAAITLRVATYGCLLCLLSASHDFIEAEQSIHVTFCFQLGKTASETHEILRIAFGTRAVGEMGFCIQKWGHLRLRSVSVRAVSRQVVCTKIIKKTDEVQFWRLGLAYGIYQRIRRAVLNMRRISPKFVKKHIQCLAARNTSMAPDHPYTPN